jgi:hypothetical protein
MPHIWPFETRYAGHAPNPWPAPGFFVRLGRSCRRMRLPSSPWHDAHAKSCGPPRMKKSRLPTSYITFSCACDCGRLNFRPFDSEAIHVASAVTLFCSPLPKGVFAISLPLKPCSTSMQETSRDSRSCTRCVSANQRGSSTNVPLTTPGPLPRSHVSSETFFGPRFCFHNASPLASNNSAGLPSASIARYSSIDSTADFCCAIAAPHTVTHAAKARDAARVFMRSPLLRRCGYRRGCPSRRW